jgi:hypothetical protein
MSTILESIAEDNLEVAANFFLTCIPKRELFKIDFEEINRQSLPFRNEDWITIYY